MGKKKHLKKGKWVWGCDANGERVHGKIATKKGLERGSAYVWTEDGGDIPQLICVDDED